MTTKSIKSLVRNFKLTLLKLVFDHKPSQSIDLTKPQRIIFDQKENLIGDMLVNTVAFRAIKQTYPNWSVHVLAGPSNQEAIRSNRFVDQIHIFTGTWAVVRELRSQQFDIYYFNKNRLQLRDFILLKYVNARVNIGRNKDGFDLFDYSINTHSETELDRYRALLGFLRASKDDYLYDFPLTSEELGLARDYVTQHLGHPVVAFNRYGNKRGKLFSSARAIQLIREVNHVYPNALIILLCSPQTKAETFELKRQLHLPNVSVAGFTRTIRDSAALIQCADLVVTPDTSIVHIACAYGKAQICVYRDQNEMCLWRPLSDKAITLLPKPPSRHVDDVDLVEFRESLVEAGQFMASA